MSPLAIGIGINIFLDWSEYPKNMSVSLLRYSVQNTSIHVQVIRPVVIAVICVGLFLILESLMLPRAMALRTNGFRMEDQRSHKRRNYILQRARDKVILRSLQKRQSYNPGRELRDSIDSISEDPLYPFPRTEDFIDYANTIANEYYLANSVETTTRKKKYLDQTIPDPSACRYIIKNTTLGDVTFPKYILEKICDDEKRNSCPLTYKCQEIYYPVAFLRRKTMKADDLIRDTYYLMPKNLNISWVPGLVNISVGCECTNKYKTK